MVQYNMDKENYLIYEGVFFRIEWFYDKAGYSQAFEYFRKASPSQKRKFLMLIKKIGDFGKIFDKTKFRYEGDEIYAFKPQPDRYLCFFKKGQKIIVTNGFCKRRNKLPLAEKTIALENKKIYEHLYEE